MLRRGIAIAILGIALGSFALFAGPSWSAETGVQQRVIGGDNRPYLLFVPPGVGKPAPLVLVFHGGGGRAEAIMARTRMNEVASRGHFIVAYPNGELRATGHGGTWNVGVAGSPGTADDVGFVRAIIADVERSYKIDRHRIYATGMSMGGVFTYRLACEMSDTFAAVAPVAATMVEPNCQPHSPVAVLHIHGTADQTIPIGGGEGLRTATGREWPPPMQGIAFWTHADGCSPAERTSAEGRDTTCHTHTSCKATVEYCVVEGGGHAWPGSEPGQRQLREQIYVTQDFPASERIWEFFAAHPKP